MFQVFSNKDVFLLQSANSGWLFLGTSHGGSVLRSLGSRVLNLGSEEPLFLAGSPEKSYEISLCLSFLIKQLRGGGRGYLLHGMAGG